MLTGVAKLAKLLVLHWTQLLTSVTNSVTNTKTQIESCIELNTSTDSCSVVDEPKTCDDVSADDSSAQLDDTVPELKIDESKILDDEDQTDSLPDIPAHPVQTNESPIKNNIVKAKPKLKNHSKFMTSRRVKSNSISPFAPLNNDEYNTLVIKVSAPVLVSSPTPKALIQKYIECSR